MRQLIAVLLLAFLAIPAAAYAQEGVPSKQQIIDTNYSGPVVHDAFWTDRTTVPADGSSLDKVEVGPGDGTSILAVVFVNRGLSDITSITGTLSAPSGFKAATGASQAIAKNNEIVQPGGTFTLFFELNVAKNARVQGYSAPLIIQYSKLLETGQYRTADLIVQFRLTGKVILDAEAINREVVPSSANEIPISISNKGTSSASGVLVTISSGNGSVAIGQKTFDIGAIGVNGTTQIRPTIYVGPSSAEIPQLINLQISYNNAYGAKTTTTIPVGLVALPRAPQAEIDIATDDTTITAGKIYDYSFALSNTSTKSLSNVFITLSTSSDSVKILGDSKWTVSSMELGYEGKFTTRVFAPTSLIGESTTFNLSLQYLSADQTRTDSVDLGSYIDGEISIRAYDIAISYIGGEPNIVGNLLNEGNTVALFTTIEVTDADGLVGDLPPLQYIGDLEENSPLPFSIPINVGSAAASNYPISLKVSYKDSLRQSHVLDIDSQVQFVPEKPADEPDNTGVMGSVIPIAIAVVIAAVIAAVVILGSRRKRALKRTFQAGKQDDIESVLDAHRKEDKK